MRFTACFAAISASVALALFGCDVAAPEGVRFAWEYPASGGSLAPTQPLVEGGRAYVAFDNQFSAFGSEEGELLWTANTSFFAGPSAANSLADGELVFVHYLTWVRALRKADGRTVWNAPLDNTGGIDGAQMAQNATHLFVGRRTEVVRIRKDTGALDARFDLRPYVPEGLNHIAYGVALSPDGATLYVATGYYVPDAPAPDGFVIALDAATGAERWAFPVPRGTFTPTGGAPQPTSAAVFGLDVDNDVVTFPGGSTVYALDRQTGAIRWSRLYPDDAFGAGATLAGDAVLVGSLQERVFCLDRATGATRWQRTVQGSLFGPFVVKEGRVYFNASFSGEAWVLNLADGAVVWTGEPPGDEFRSPVGVGDGRMVIVGDANVYGLTLP